MRRPVRTAEPDTTVSAAAAGMRAHRVGSLVVVNAAGAPVGIVTERDLVHRVLADGRDPGATRIADVWSTPVHTVEPMATVDEAAARMRDLRIKRLVVVLDGRVRGILTATDVAYARPSLSKEFLETWVKPRWEG